MNNLIKFLIFSWVMALGFSCVKVLPEPVIGKIWLTADIKRDTMLGSDTTFFKGIIKVHEGAKLTIKPGATLVFNDEVPSALVVMQGGKIIAKGNKNGVIRMTSYKKKEPGAWGGLIILGKEQIINDDPNIPINVDMIKDLAHRNYSGSDPEGSGELKCVEIFYAGGASPASPEAVSIFNGLTLWGVSKNTLIDSIHIHKSRRNGIVILGGNVNIKHTILTSNYVNSLYYNETWLGKSQFLLIQMVGPTLGSGIYFLNSEKVGTNPEDSPRFHNSTIVGDDNAKYGINVEANGKGQFFNTLFLGFEESKPIRLKGPSRITEDFVIEWVSIQIKSSTIDVINTADYNEDDIFSDKRIRCVGKTEYQIRAPFHPTNPDFSTKTLLKCMETIPYYDKVFFIDSQYYGAISNSKESDWTLGWATYP